MTEDSWIKKLEHPKSPDKFMELVRDLAACKFKEPANWYSSKDGGIDVYVPTKGVAIQCKFHETGTKKKFTLEALVREMNEEFDTIGKHLTGGRATVGQAQYGIWLKPQAVKEYIYTFSRRLPNPEAHTTFVDAIKRRLNRLSDELKMPHLKLVRVDIWDAQRISTLINDYGTVKLNLFGMELPPHVEAYTTWKADQIGNASDPANRNFHAYLFPPALEYQLHADESKRPSAAFELLEDASTIPLVLVHGLGGQGKSRFLVEVAELALAKKWVVLQLAAKQIHADALDKLANTFATSDILLLVDYAENAPTFDSLYRRLRQLNDAGAKLRMLAASRLLRHFENTAADDPSIPKIELSVSTNEKNDLVTRILGPGLVDLADKCNGVPVFAAFIRLLSDRKKTSDIDALRKEAHFQKWLRAHVANILPGRQEVQTKTHLAQLCAILPASDAAMTTACDNAPNIKGYKEALLADGWLTFSRTDGGLQWQIAHHLIADGAIIEALREQNTALHRANELLRFAKDTASQKNVVTALGRVAYEAEVSAIGWDSCFVAESKAWAGMEGEIAHSGLIAPPKLVGWLDLMYTTKTDLVADLGVQHAIGAVVRDAATTPRALTEPERTWIKLTLNETSNVDLQSFLLSHWLRADAAKTSGDHIEIAKTWIATYGNERYAGYVYAAWLDAGHDREVARPMFTGWLTVNGVRLDATHPIGAWLRQITNAQELTDNGNAIVEATDRWLNSRFLREQPSAGYIYEAWLKAKGPADRYVHKIKEWLNRFEGRLESQHVFNAWLENSRRVAEVEQHVKSWLAVEGHPVRWEAQYVYLNWLRAGGAAEIVKTGVLAWLNTSHADTGIGFASNMEAGRRVITSWLEHAGDVVLVEPFVTAWLEHDGQATKLEAQYVYLGWLRAHGRNSTIQPHFVRWLNEAPITEDHESVLSAWLKNGGDNNVVSSSVAQWCSEPKFAALARADYLVANWRDAGGERYRVQAAVAVRSVAVRLGEYQYWLGAPLFRDRQTAEVSLASVLRHATDSLAFRDDVKDALVRCTIDTAKPVAHVLRFWIEKTKCKGFIILREEIVTWLEKFHGTEHADFALAELLELSPPPDSAEIFERIALEHLEARHTQLLAGDVYLFRAWVRSNRRLEPIVKYMKMWFARHGPGSRKKTTEIRVALAQSGYPIDAWDGYVDDHPPP